MRKGKRNSGFSLIEVMTALAVLMIGLVAIISLQVSAIHWLGVARHRSVATQLGSDVLEYLKTAPVSVHSPIQPGDPVVVVMDGGTPSKSIIDADNVALLNDTAMGDGLMTWHRLPPMNQSYQIGSATTWNPSSYYIAVYGVEWGGNSGDGPTQYHSAAGLSGNAAAQYPEILPGANQMYIEVWIGWVESGDQPTITGVSHAPSVWDYYTHVNTTMPGYPAVFPKHKIMFNTIRTIP